MQIRANLTALVVLLLASAGALLPASAGDATSTTGAVAPSPCSTLPQPPVVTPCPTLPLAIDTNFAVAAESDLIVVTPAPTPAVKPVPAATSTTAASSCTPVSVKGDATYCISGRVCSGEGSSLPGTNCPKKGDVAISRCLSKLRTYDAAAGNCVAQQDAQCVVIETGVWGCVFPGTAPLATESLSDPVALEILSPAQPNTITVSGASVAQDVPSDHAQTLFAAMLEEPSESETTGANASNPALNGVVAVAALVVAAFGVAAVRNRQRERRASRTNSTRYLGRLEELSTPI